MYTILITDTNELIVTKKERIMLRSKLVESLLFLADEIYKNEKMSEYTVVLEYLLPVSKRYRSEILTLSSEKYTSLQESYDALVDYIVSALDTDTAFFKKMYKYMINSGSISGR